MYTVTRRRRRRHEEEQAAALEKLRVVVDEDITAFGEELDRLDFHPGEPGADDAMRADYERALDAYEQAKTYMAAARKPEDVRAVTQAVEDGRYALASLTARRAGEPVPERRPPCFFDPRHGPVGRRRPVDPAGRDGRVRCRCARPTGRGWPTGATRGPRGGHRVRPPSLLGGGPGVRPLGGRLLRRRTSCRACWSAPCSAA
ncbi:hypothetical protein STENM223S_00127 [Streptomyces tendae]